MYPKKLKIRNTIVSFFFLNFATHYIWVIEGQNIRKIEVFNTLGQHVYAEETENELMTIDLTNHTAGIYLIRIVTDNGIWNHQVMKR